MIPIRDDAPRTTTPYVTYVLVALNLLVFLFEVVLEPRSRAMFVFQFGLVPTRLAALFDAGHPGLAMMPIVTSMFLHASWLHLIFNMWGLWVFGDNVEDYLGHFRYLLFYLLTGVAAALLHLFFNAGSQVPSVGASGAIAGVMGGYFLLYPSARVLTLIPIFFLYFTWLPAWLLLGYWFVVQFLSGAATSITHQGQGGGIAWWAHVGGFAAGAAVIKLFPARAPKYRYTEW